MITLIALAVVLVVVLPFLAAIVGVGTMALLFILGIFAYPFAWLYSCVQVNKS